MELVIAGRHQGRSAALFGLDPALDSPHTDTAASRDGAVCSPPSKSPILCKVVRRPPLLPSLTSQGCGALLFWELPLTGVPASSTLIYRAIWCQVIAHQYPIYHPACHRLWLLFHKAKAFEKGPVTQSTGRGLRKCNTFKFFSPHFASSCSALPWTGGGTAAASRAGSCRS